MHRGLIMVTNKLHRPVTFHPPVNMCRSQCGPPHQAAATHKPRPSAIHTTRRDAPDQTSMRLKFHQIFKNAKSDLRTFLERPKSDKNWKSEKHRNPREQREKWAFPTFKISKLCHFSIYLLEIDTYTYTYLNIWLHGASFRFYVFLIFRVFGFIVLQFFAFSVLHFFGFSVFRVHSFSSLKFFSSLRFEC